MTFLDNCTHASWSGRLQDENCSLDDFGFNLTDVSDTSVMFNFTPGYYDVGTYWVNFSVSDFNGTCPHEYCDESVYEENQTSESYVLKFNVFSMLRVNASNCSGASVMEGETFNCTIDITTRDADDELNFSSYGTFEGSITQSDNRTWFQEAFTDNASNFFYSLPISVTPGKEEVGNWTIDFTVWDVLRLDSEMEQISIFVNFTESNVSLGLIDNVTLYENGNFTLNATDADLLIMDNDVKVEVLTFDSDVFWIDFEDVGYGDNYTTSRVSINHTYVLNSEGEGNYSVNVSVTDDVGNLDWSVFVVEILNESAPEWNLTEPVFLNLTEDEGFVYNVSLNVSDPDDNVTFYYEEVFGEICSLNSSSFNSSGMINFTPSDCDVGFHNVTIISGNGKLNSSWDFVFNVSNVGDVPVISHFYGYNVSNSSNYSSLEEGFSFLISEGVVANFSLAIGDDDFLIPSWYNESLSVNVTFENSSGSFFDLFNFSFSEFSGAGGGIAVYSATFAPQGGDVDDYTVFVNITDDSGNFINRTWFLNVTGILDSPVLEQVENKTITIHDYLNFSLNASDDEDDRNGLNLIYSVLRLDEDAPNLTVVGNVVGLDMNSNNSYAGEWAYNVTVIDNDSMIDWQVFWVSVYGFADVVLPVENFTFNGTEDVSGILNFTINHSVGDSLVYEFWTDDISCSFQNSSNCSYGNLSFRKNVTSFGNGSVVGWNFSPSFTDESYGNLKNLTVSVYPNSSSLNLSQKSSLVANFSFKLNISHANAPVVFYSMLRIPDAQKNNDQNITYDLSEFFSDEDVGDVFYSQNLSLSFLSNVSSSNIDANGARIPANVSQNGWDLVFNTGHTVADFSEIVNVTVSDLNFSNNNITLSSAASGNFELEFTVPTTTTTPSSGGSSGSSTKLKFYSLRIIVPEDVIISDDDYIEIPFGLENSGTIDLRGIDLSSEVLYNNKFSDNIRIDLGDTYVDVLKSGERKEYTMKIFADTDRSGKYKATIFANISSPKFSDWGDFFIDLRKTNDSEAEELLIFTEKIIADNPECLELTEVFRRAQDAFEAGNNVEAIRLASEVSAACEDAIMANEQVKYRIEGFVERNFYYISFVTLIVFFIGFIFYVYKRVRFNKYVGDSYVR